MAHRGPDDAGEWWSADGRVGLAHRRLAILDLSPAGRQRLFLARDRAGQKPLFYHLDRGTLSFASELKALMARKDFPRRIDPAALDCYLAMGAFRDIIPHLGKLSAPSTVMLEAI